LVSQAQRAAWALSTHAPRPVARAGLAALAYSPFCLRLRDQMRVKVSPSVSSNRLA
jgi:hypothetical protein